MDLTVLDARVPADSSGLAERIKLRLEEWRTSHLNCRRPLVTLAYAQSLDGSIAVRRGESLAISNPDSQRFTHQLRSIHDAILIGINTVLSDNPRLTVRLVEGRNPQPVIVDSRLRVDPTCRLVSDGRRPIVFTGVSAPRDKEERLRSLGVKILRLREATDGTVDLDEVLRQLGEMGLESVMIEGGARIITTVLHSGLADQLVVTISPRFVCGLRAVRRVSPSETGRIAPLDNIDYACLGGDIVMRADFAAGGAS